MLLLSPPSAGNPPGKFLVCLQGFQLCVVTNLQDQNFKEVVGQGPSCNYIQLKPQGIAQSSSADRDQSMESTMHTRLSCTGKASNLLSASHHYHVNITTKLWRRRSASSFSSSSSSCRRPPAQIRVSLEEAHSQDYPVQSPSFSISIPAQHTTTSKKEKNARTPFSGHGRQTERSESLVSEIRKMLSEEPSLSPYVNSNISRLLSITDKFCCLGISRHFKQEIRQYLDSVLRAWNSNQGEIRDAYGRIDVRNTALAFELLRVHGYPNISRSVFGKAEVIVELNSNSAEATRTALAVFRASAVQFPGEKILKNMHSFVTRLLKSWISATENEVTHSRLTAEAKYWLENPWAWTPPRWQARRFIHIFSSQQLSTTINLETKMLELAKLDFNAIQAIHKAELQGVCRWWEGSDAANLNMFRRRHMESYLVMATALYEPEYAEVRIAVAMASTALFVLDDMYDTPAATLPQLRLLTRAFTDWDTCNRNHHALPLPDSTRICLRFVMETLQQVFSKYSYKPNFKMWMAHMRRMWLTLVESFEREAEWEEAAKQNGTELPDMHEYLKNGSQSSGYGPIFAMAELLLCKFDTDNTHFNSQQVVAFEDVCLKIVRILNDIYGPQLDRNIDQGLSDNKGNDQSRAEAVSSVTCLMKENPTLNMNEAIEQLKEMVNEFSRDVTYLYLQGDGDGKGRGPPHRKKVAWELTRISQFLYRRSKTNEMKTVLRLLVSQPID